MSNWQNAYPKKGLVAEALNFAKVAHKDSKRQSGDPYVTHCLKVAETVNNWGLDEASVAAALLHDIIEDTEYTLKDIKKKFGEEVAFLVDGLTKLKSIDYPDKNPQAETWRKLILSFSKDLRVIILKLADRLHNMQTIKFLTKDKQERIARETMEIYAPLAYRLGMQSLSGELEDLAFPYLYPEEYKWLRENFKERYSERERDTVELKSIIEKVLAEQGIRTIAIDSRAKKYSSLYRKLIRYDMDFEKIYDLVALRVVVPTMEDCYRVLGAIHQKWPPLPGRIKDYIARPKPNGYRSLHTTVFCDKKRIIEVQIRTEEMHEEAELGIAAHWAYHQAKSSKKSLKNWQGVENRKELLWVKQLRDWQRHVGGQEEFINSMKVDFFKDRIFVTTPKNDVIDLPVGATPVDFAYQIHTDVGNRCVGARVNGKIEPLDYELNSGDMVEVIIRKGKKPSADWLRFVKTEMARKKIRAALRVGDKKIAKPATEFKITIGDRAGYLKELTSVFAEAGLNITYLKGETDQRGAFSKITLRCEPLTQSKARRMLLKLRNMPEMKEVSYKMND